MPAQGGLKARLTGTLERVRSRWSWVDHAIRTQQHFSSVNGGVQAGGVTYFAFLSFFPVLALAFFAVGNVARVWPDAQDNLEAGITQVLPGLVGPDAGQISLATIQEHAGAAGLIGLAGVLYAGLGWVSALRGALVAVFALPPGAKPNFLVGKARDVMALAVIGATLIASVSVSGLVSGFSEQVLGWLQLDAGSTWVLWSVSLVVGGAASAVLFFALFRLLARPGLPRRALWSGALFGAVAFEALKWASTYLLQATRDQPAAQAFGIALILLVWMNYFSRVVLYAASWAQTAPAARAAHSATIAGSVPQPAADGAAVPTPEQPGRRGGRLGSFLAGAGLTGALAVWAAQRARRRETDDGSAGD